MTDLIEDMNAWRLTAAERGHYLDRIEEFHARRQVVLARRVAHAELTGTLWRLVLIVLLLVVVAW